MSDTAPTIEAPYSSAKLWRSVGGTAFVSIASALLAFGPYYNSPRVAVLGFGAAFCGLCSLCLMYLAIAKSGQMAFTVGPAGIYDERISKDMISWSAVETISTWHPRGLPERREGVLIKLKPTEAARLNIKSTARFIETIDKTVAGPGGFVIGPAVADVNSKRLFEVIKHYLPSAQIMLFANRQTVTGAAESLRSRPMPQSIIFSIRTGRLRTRLPVAW